MDVTTIEHLVALAKALGMIAAGTALVLYLLNRASKTSDYPRTERRTGPRE